MYRYALLRPRDAAGAEEHNAGLLGPLTLGIEVTEPELARRCGLGNVDPQHDGSGSGQAAIEACLDRPLPPSGATLVTIRPDLDAFGAMALLTLRAYGNPLGQALRERVAEAGTADRFARGSWPGPRPLPASEAEMLALLGGGGVVPVLTAAMRERTVSIEEKVAIASRWLSDGTLPAAFADAPHRRAKAVWEALAAGRLRPSRAVRGRIAVAVSDADGALQLGYCLAPVVVALHPRFAFPDGSRGAKFTLAQFAAGYADLDGVAAELNARERNWGGSPTIKGSPQGHPSRIALDAVVETVARYLAPRPPAV